jgi:uncharacterized protein
MQNAERDPAKRFLGIGWAFPPGVEADGATAEAIYEEDVRQAIWIILGTNPGERVMRPDFGAGLRAFVFEPVNATSKARIRNRVEESLITWERRIDVETVQISSDASEPFRLMIEIQYRVRATNSIQNLVYPFYLEEGTAS